MVSSETLVAILVAICGSSGLWGLLMYLLQHRHKKLEDALMKDNAERQMLRGIGHAQIVKMCRYYIEKGYVTPEQYADLREHLFAPYETLGGNGSAAKLVEEVEKLPIRDETPITPMR